MGLTSGIQSDDAFREFQFEVFEMRHRLLEGVARLCRVSYFY